MKYWLSRIVLCLPLLLARPAFATITFDVAQSAGTTDTNNVTTASVTLAGNFVVVVAADYRSATACTIADSRSSTFTIRTTYQTTAEQRIRIAYATGVTTGAGYTVSCNGTSSFPAVSFAAFSGVATTSAFDQESGATSDSAVTFQPTIVTPTVANEVVIAGASAASAITITVNAPFTIPTNGSTTWDGTHYGVSVAYDIQTTATARNPTWTGNGVAHVWAADTATFKASGGAVGTVFDGVIIE